jgi:hypothetical protein
MGRQAAGCSVLRSNWGAAVLHAMRNLALMAILAAGHAQAQTATQNELNALTGAPAGTRCFKSVKLAQEFATRYVASGLCPQLRPMDPGQFLRALEVQNAADSDFTGETCQVQFGLMMRAGREWVEKDRAASCAETARKLSRLKGLNAFRGLVR